MKSRKFTLALFTYCIGVIISLSQLTTGYLNNKISKPNQNSNDYNLNNLSLRSVHYPRGDGGALYRPFDDDIKISEIQKANQKQ